MSSFETLSISTGSIDITDSLQSEAPVKPDVPNTTKNSLREFIAAAKAINPKRFDDYKFWVYVGMALYRKDPKLLWLWKQLSQQSSKYEDGCCEKRWDGFQQQPGGQSITPDYIFHLAKENGWEPNKGGSIEYEIIDSSELAGMDMKIEYLIDRLLARNQHTLIGGVQKTLKTSIAIAAAVALASGTNFLGQYRCVPSTCLFMSGESGLPVIRNTAERICKSKGLRLADLGKELYWTHKLPQFGKRDYIGSLEEVISDLGIEVLFIDPLYLAMPGSDAGNIIQQGELLSSIGNICTELEVTLIMLHHLKKSSKKNPTLTDFAWAGYAEFARQWWLLSRLNEYIEGSGQHDLVASIGGSAGHSEKLMLRINEGSIHDPGGRHWAVEVESYSEHLEKEESIAKESKANAQSQRVIEYLEKQTEPVNKTKISEALGIHRRNWESAMNPLIESGKIEIVTNGKRIKYQITNTASLADANVA